MRCFRWPSPPSRNYFGRFGFIGVSLLPLLLLFGILQIGSRFLAPMNAMKREGSSGTSNKDPSASGM